MSTTDTPAPPPSPDDLIREYALLVKENRDLDVQKKKNQERLNAIKGRVLDTFTERGSRSTDLVGIGNLHLKPIISVKVVRSDGDYSRDVTESERQAAREALQAAGLHEQIKANFNLTSIKGLYSEWDKRGEHPPPELDGAFRVEKLYDLGLTT